MGGTRFGSSPCAGSSSTMAWVGCRLPLLLKFKWMVILLLWVPLWHPSTHTCKSEVLPCLPLMHEEPCNGTSQFLTVGSTALSCIKVLPMLWLIALCQPPQ